MSHLPTISVVGGGLAGSECAYQLAEMGFNVHLFEMRPKKSTEAHKSSLLGELVCSNSLGTLQDQSAPGQLKWEMEQLGSLILQAGHHARVPAGHALGVDRIVFGEFISQKIKNHPRITVRLDEVKDLGEIPRPTVIATGPLTSDDLASSIQDHFDRGHLYFYDAIAPVISTDSINFDICYKASRYDKGGADYINCPMNKEEYYSFVDAVRLADVSPTKSFEEPKYFESCLPIEVLASRGPQTLSFGPMKPRGLRDPKTGREPYAVVQLRQENTYGTCFNMVGFQTKMKYGDQVRVFRMIPGLEKAEFLKLGSLHRNMFINSPKLLTSFLSSKKDPMLFFAGQITGVEGYFDSASIGMLVAKYINRFFEDRPHLPPPPESALGALTHFLSEIKDNFQPTNSNWGLFPPLEFKAEDKKQAMALRAKNAFSIWKEKLLNPN